MEPSCSSFSIDDVRYVLSLIDGAAGALPPALPAGVAGRLAEAEAVEAVVDALSIDLDALAQSMFGITDPIGQLAEWLRARLSELASWLASTVESIVRALWSTYISPAFSSLSGAVSWVRTAVEAVARTVAAIGDATRSIAGQIGNLPSIISGSISAAASAITGALTPMLNSIQSALTGLASSLASMISSATDLLSSLARAVAAFPGMLSAAVDRLLGAVSAAARSIAESVASVAERAAAGFAALQSALAAFSRAVVDALTSIHTALSTLPPLITGGFSSLQGALSSLGSTLVNALQTVAQPILGGLAALAKAVASGFTTIQGALSSAFDRLQSALASSLASLAERFSTGLGELVKLIGAVAGAVGEALKPVIASVQKGFEGLGAALSEVSRNLLQVGALIAGFVNAVANLPGMLVEGFKSFFEGLIKWLSDIANAVAAFLRDPLGALKGAIDWLAAQIWSLLPDWLKGAIVALQNAWQTFVNGLQAFLRDPVGFIQARLSELAAWIWERLPDWLRGFVEGLSKFFLQDVPGFFKWLAQGFQDFLKDPAGWLYNNLALPLWKGLQWLGEQVWNLLPDWLKGVITMAQKAFTEYLPAFLGWVWEGFMKFIRDPIGFVRDAVVKPLADALMGVGRWLVEQAGRFLQSALAAFKSVWDLLAGAVASLGQAISGSVVSVVSSAWLWARAGVEGVVSLAKSIVEELQKMVSEVLGRHIGESLVAAVKMEGLSTPEYLKVPAVHEEAAKLAVATLGLMTLPLTGRLVTNIIAWKLRAIGFAIGHITPRTGVRVGGRGGVRGALRGGGSAGVGALVGPSVQGEGGAEGGGGVGANASVASGFDIGKAVGSALTTFANEITTYSTEIGRALVYGLAIWLSRPYVSVFNLVARNLLPVYQPPDEFWVVSLRRLMPHKQFSEVKKVASYYLDLMGYSDFLKTLMLSDEKELSLTVRDRFETERVVPLSLIYVTPSPFDVAAMMVRDMFATYADYEKLAKASGMHESVAALYALLRYRYPSPEMLSRFYWRGVTRLLWSPGLELDETTRRDLRERLKVGFDPSPPVSLNRNPALLNDIIRDYLRWQDYFPLAWEEGYPSDAAVIHELTADLPTKIDVRWMVKWTLLEQLVKLGFTMESEIPEIVARMRQATGRELYAESLQPGITMDASLMARLIEATGLHPYWTPIVAVAEALNAVADEKTMVRTAVMAGFKEGLLSLAASERVLSGVLVVDFTTGYVDPATGRPVTFTYKVPMAWLPLERRLIQVKSLFDRVIDLHREVASEVARGVRQMALSPRDAAALLSKAMALLQRHLNEKVREVTGFDLRLELDREYIELYSSIQEMVSGVELVVRLRLLAQRLLGWVLYRVAYGYVTEGELGRLVEVLARKFGFTAAEAEAVMELSKVLHAIAARELIPTPSQLSTFAEYTVVPPQVVETVLDAYRVPQEYRMLWRTYIAVKPLKSDFRALITAAAKMFRRNLISREAWERVLAEARAYGFTDVEIELIRRRVEIETVAAGSEEYVPPLSTLASMVEYIDVPPEVVAAVLQARGVAGPWAALWIQYITARRVSAETNTLVSTYRRIVEYFSAPEDLQPRIVELMRSGGWTQREIAVFEMDLALRKIYRTLTAVIPTLRQFVSDALYLEEWERLLDDLLRARGIDAARLREQVEYYKKLVKSRKVNRRVSWYVTRVMNAYAARAITLDQARARLEALKRYGLDDEEINLILDGLQLEEAYRAAIFRR